MDPTSLTMVTRSASYKARQGYLSRDDALPRASASLVRPDSSLSRRDQDQLAMISHRPLTMHTRRTSSNQSCQGASSVIPPRQEPMSSSATWSSSTDAGCPRTTKSSGYSNARSRTRGMMIRTHTSRGSTPNGLSRVCYRESVVDSPESTPDSRHRPASRAPD